MRFASHPRSLVLAALATAAVAILVVGFLLRPARGRAQDATCTGAPYAEVQIDTSPRIDLQVARTNQEHEVGLMNVEYLPPDSGMVFVYQAEAREGYWMYHTLIPLSIAWIDKNGTIVDIQDMARLNDPNDVQEASRTVYNPAAPYWYALEVNRGWFSDHGVGVGQQISFCLGS
ncbi:MAG TPA: DUF192 domain-containing protein [Chloroflexota bacterium]|nr:DUF192 domain-containing protein [Chloroflexota bacterium]